MYEYDYCVPSINKFGFTTCSTVPKYVKCSVHHSDLRPKPNRVNFAPYLGLGKKDKIRRDNKDCKDASAPAAKRGTDDSVFEFKATETDYKLVKEEDDIDSEMEGDSHERTIDVAKSRRQMMRRSSFMAKQVISIRSALSLGFVTQLWVDTSSWIVMVVEVKPNLLSGDSERFLLKEITQVGDFILVEDEAVMEDDIKLVGLETLVGYTVKTPRRQIIGKVRGYTFNISAGTLESLELDSFGISIIPSSLVSTYALLVDDVLEVFPDTVIVCDAAVSRLQRLTKGFWDGQSAGKEFRKQLDAGDVPEEYSERPNKSRKKRRNRRISADDLEAPMDFL